MFNFFLAKQRNRAILMYLSLMMSGVIIQEIYGQTGKENFLERFTAHVSAKPLPVYEKPAKGTTITIPVIVYHSIRPSFPEETLEMKRYSTEPHIFEQELVFLKESGYHVISFKEMLDYFDQGIPLPAKPVILTFDDGWRNQYVYAFPLLKKYGFTGTFFVFTNAMKNKNFMSWDELREMDAAGMTIAGHSKTHPYLTKIFDPNTLTEEIADSKKILEEQIGKPVVAFAYPFGSLNAAVVEETLRAGYRIGRTSDAGTKHTEETLPRLTALYDKNNLATFINLVTTQ